MRPTQFLFGLLVTLVVGCSVEPRDEDGDKDPKLGDYFVKLSEYEKEVELDPNSPVKLFDVTLTGECLSPLGSDICAANKPLWIAKEDSFVSARIDNPTLKQTTVGIVVETGAYLRKFPVWESSIGMVEDRWITFLPSNLSPDLNLQPSGGLRFNVKLRRTQASLTTTRTEQAADKLTLTATPSRLESIDSESVGDARSRTCSIRYKGPKNRLTLASFSPEGAADFKVEIPGGIGYPLKGDGTGLDIKVTYIGKLHSLRGTKLTLKVANFRDEDEAAAKADVLIDSF